MARGERGSKRSRNATPADLCEYAAWVIASDLEKMLSHIDEVEQNKETDPVHDMRVASRKTRAALELFAVCFPDPDYARLERRVKEVTDLLSAVRDLDVMQETLSDRLHALPIEQREGLQGFMDQLHARRQKRQKPVEKMLHSLEQEQWQRCFKRVAGRNRREHDNG